MTESEGASSEVANESRETSTMNALAGIVQSVVEEMKAMNRRTDQLKRAHKPRRRGNQLRRGRTGE